MSRDRRTPAEIEREIEETRRRMTDRIEILEQRISPGQIVNQAMHYARGGGETAQSLGSAVRDNPVPFLLTGIGLTWLIASGASSERSAARGMETGSEEGMATHAKDKARGAIASVKEKIGHARERFSSGGEDSSGRMEHAKDRAREVAGRSRERARELRGRLARMMEEQPALAGGLALLLGSVFGASLPASRLEDEWLGDVRDRALDRVREAGHAAKEQAREVGEQVREEVREQAHPREAQAPREALPGEPFPPGPEIPPRPIDH